MILLVIGPCLATRVLPGSAKILMYHLKHLIVHCLARDVRCDVDVRPLSWITLAKQEGKLSPRPFLLEQSLIKIKYQNKTILYNSSYLFTYHTFTMSPLNNEYYKEKTDGFDHSELEWKLATASAVDRVRMVIDHFGTESVTLLTSFGVQSGVMLALGMYIKYVHG